MNEIVAVAVPWLQAVSKDVDAPRKCVDHRRVMQFNLSGRERRKQLRHCLFGRKQFSFRVRANIEIITIGVSADLHVVKSSFDGPSDERAREQRR